MHICKYDPDGGWQYMVCDRCNRFRWCCQHHIDRKQNSDDVVWICSNGNPVGIVYTDACHALMDDKIEEMIEEGYYRHFDSIYRKKESSPNKWKLKKK